MKVFGCYRTGGYSGGLILAAGNTLDEAYNAYLKDPKYSWMHWEIDTDEYDEYYYPKLNWMEFSELEAKCDVPKVICEDGYTE